MKTQILMLLLCLCVLPGWAQWSSDPVVNKAVMPDLLIPIMTTDMENGVIIVGQSHPFDPIIFAQRLDVNGHERWRTPWGNRVTDSELEQWLVHPGYADEEFVMSDGVGGCYIAYQLAHFLGYDSSGEGDLHDIGLFLQRLDADGNRLFGEIGLPLMSGEEDSTHYIQRLRHWILDGYGGVYAVWIRINDFDRDNNGTYIARVSGEGEVIWGPNRMHYSPDAEYLPFLDQNFYLNLYLSFETIPPTPDRFLKLDLENGSIISDNEIEIGVGMYGFNAFYDYCDSDNGSAIFAFRDFRADTLRIQKLDGDGNKLWGEEPKTVDKILFGYSAFDVESDRQGGAYVYFKTPDDTFHLVHFNREGRKLWERTFLSKLHMGKKNEMIAVGGRGEVFVLLEKIRFLTKVSFEGELLWNVQVTNRDTVASTIDYYELLADDLGGCIVLWQEIGNSYYGFRAQRIDKNGSLGGPTTAVAAQPPAIIPRSLELMTLYPNPFTKSLTIDFALPHTQSAAIEVYDLLGKQVATVASESFSSGAHTVHWDGTDPQGRLLPSGIFFVTLKAGESRMVRKIVLIR